MKQLCFLKDVYLRVPLQSKIFYLLATVGVLFSVFNGFFNLFIGLPIITVIISFITGGGCLAALIYSYKQKNYKGPAYAAFHVLILFILPFLWITNSGSKGPTGFFYIFILILIGIIVDRPKIPFLLALMLVTLATLVYIEIKYPLWIVSYDSRVAQTLDMAVSAFMVGIITLGILLRLMKEYNLRIKELNDMHSKLYELSITDELTGVFNRRFIMKELENHLDMQKKSTMSLIMLDIDNFKNINDTFGHQIGDEVIKGTSRILAGHVRHTDYVGRIGGEEFLVLLKDASLEDTISRAESMRLALENLTWSLPSLKVTISGGVYQCNPMETMDEILEKVDKHLYHAKTNGKNKIIADCPL